MRNRFQGNVQESGLPRVLLVHSSDEMYGSDRIVLETVDALTGSFGAEPLAEVSVWLPADTRSGSCGLSRELRARGIEVRHVELPILRRNLANPRGLGRLTFQAFSAMAALRRETFDMLYCATSVCLPLAPLARWSGIPRVTAHFQEPWGQREKHVLAALARFTTTRLAIADHVAASTGLPSRTLHVVPNGVPRVAVADSSRGDGISAPTYVVASRWSSGKGHRTLLTAWNAAGCPGRLLVLGGMPPLGRGIDVPAQVAELVSVPGSVVIIGEVPDIATWVAGADALILPTDTPEGFGLVLIEAFRAGKPVIASSEGGPGEIVRSGSDGWLFKNRDVAGLAEILRTLSPADLKAAGKQALLRYEDEYSHETFHRRLRAVLGPALREERRLVEAGRGQR